MIFRTFTLTCFRTLKIKLRVLDVQSLHQHLKLQACHVPLDEIKGSYRSWLKDKVCRHLQIAVLYVTYLQPLPLFQCYCLRSEEHTSELQSRENLVCRLLL